MAAELLAAFKKCVDEQFNCLGFKSYRSNAGRWD